MKIPFLLIFAGSAGIRAAEVAVSDGVHQPEVPMWVTVALLAVVAYFMRNIHQDIRDLAKQVNGQAVSLEARVTRSDLEQVKRELHERMNACDGCNRRAPVAPVIAHS